VKKLERLDEATTPDGTVLTLFRHDGAYSIRVDGVELMSTRRHHSEEKLAELVCLPLRERSDAQVLIGGLGFGFTLKAALRSLAHDACVVVAELVAGVIAWNRNPDYALAAESLRDPRVDLRQEDVANVLRKSPGRFDAIMLDVDNGADALTHAGNAQLYRHTGIQLAVAALRDNGRLAYWSAKGDAAFEDALRDAGLTVEVSTVRAHSTSGTWHTLIVARAA
jgi:spermidine synthase